MVRISPAFKQELCARQAGWKCKGMQFSPIAAGKRAHSETVAIAIYVLLRGLPAINHDDRFPLASLQLSFPEPEAG
jgi:hypothetical protein